MERGKEKQQTACPGEPGAVGSKIQPCSGGETLPAPVDASIDRLIGVGGMHESFAGEARPRLFPESLWLFIHDGALHRHIGWVRFWLLPGAFLSVSIVFLVLLAPAIACGRALYLVRHGRLADLGHLSWYAPFLPLVFSYISAYKFLLCCIWRQYRQVDKQNLGPRYRFPVLYLCLRVIEHYMIRLLPNSLIRKHLVTKQTSPRV